MKKRSSNRKFPRSSVAVTAILALILIFIYTACGEKYTSPAERILGESVKAMGGMKNATNWETRYQKGLLTVYSGGWGTLKGEYTIQAKKPNMLKVDQDFSAFDHPFYYTYYLSGEDVWVEVNMGVRQHERYTDMMLDRYNTIVGANVYYLTSCDTFFVDDTVEPDSLLTEIDFDRVGCVIDGDTTYFDIRKDTHYPVRIIENGNQDVLLEDFRESNGYMYPFKQTVYQNGALNSVVEWEEISFDVDIDDSIFETNKPAPAPEPEPEPEQESEAAAEESSEESE